MADQVSGLLSPWLRKKRREMVCPYIRGRTLDYGCGVGVLAEICESDSYLGVDIDEKSITIARKNYPLFRFETYVPKTEYFDTIVLLAVIEHISAPVSLLKKFKQMLRPEGHIVLTTPSPFFEWIYTIGPKIGLFSMEASKDHEQLIDYRIMQEAVYQAGLVIDRYERFLFGVNQLFVLKKT
jgi:2-polyprenyl-3-methyl-5-hydroxy-6-metoxy-1,4-benzoquinol methylase